MTYCVGLLLNEGIVLLSDTRTNAGLDNISTYRKMFFFEEPGERVICVLTAGSLSVTQTTLARLRDAIGHRKAWLAASTHPGEEEVILDAQQRLDDRLLILAPRHPDRAPAIRAALEAAYAAGVTAATKR